MVLVWDVSGPRLSRGFLGLFSFPVEIEVTIPGFLAPPKKYEYPRGGSHDILARSRSPTAVRGSSRGRLAAAPE